MEGAAHGKLINIIDTHPKYNSPIKVSFPKVGVTMSPETTAKIITALKLFGNGPQNFQYVLRQKDKGRERLAKIVRRLVA